MGILITIVVAVLVLLAIAGLVIGIYNSLVRLRNRFQNAFSQIEVQLKRRYDLIPNLVETAKAYMAHERETLEAVIAARNQAGSALASAAKDQTGGGIAQLASAESALGGALGRLFAVMEAYPDLKANQNMMQLSEELTSTENKVAFARQAYNDSVMAYNTYRQSFPPVIFAGMFGHSRDAELLNFGDEKIHVAPKVAF